MTIFKTIKDVFSNTLNRLSKDTTGNVLDVSDRTGDVGTPRDDIIDITEMWNLYQKCESLRNIIDRIVTDVSSIQLRAAPRNKAEEPSSKTLDRVREVQELLDNPNKRDENLSSIRAAMLRDLLIMDSGCIEVVYDEYDETPMELYATSAKWIRKNTDEKGNFIDPSEAYYLYHRGKLKAKFNQREIVFLIACPTAHSVYGLSRVATLAVSIACDILAALHNGNFFLNYGEVSGIMQFLGMGKNELNAIRARWESTIKGKPHKLLLTNKESKFTRMAESNKDMEFMDYQRHILQKMMGAYGMQPLIMGIRDPGTGRLNSVQQTQAYIDRALKPIIKLECYHYTTEIVKAGFGYNDVIIEPIDMERMDIITQSEIDVNEANAGILKINEIRARRGLPPVPWGERPLSNRFKGTKPGPDAETPSRISDPEERKPGSYEDKDYSNILETILRDDINDS